MLIKDTIFKKYYNFYIYVLFFISMMSLIKIFGEKKFSNSIDMKLYNNCLGSVVIGGGPAGITAGLYSSRFGLPTAIFMGVDLVGGQLTTTGVVENFPGVLNLTGTEIIENCKRQAEAAGSMIFYEEVKSIDIKTYPYKIITNRDVYYSFSIILATGSSVKKLNCKGEDSYWGKGVSSCAICDAPLYKNKEVCVVGGGDSACEEALQLVPHAKKIYVLVRGSSMRASHILQERIKANSKIIIIYNTEIFEIKGNGNAVEDVILNDKKEKKNYSLSEKYSVDEISGVFIAIGHSPNTSLVKDIVKINENGNIICQGRSQLTSFPFIFACGDVVADTHKQATVACGQGASAAIEAFDALQKININSSFFDEYSSSFLKKKADYASVENNLNEKKENDLDDASVSNNLNNTIICDGTSCSIVSSPKVNESENLSKSDEFGAVLLKKYQEIQTQKQYEQLLGIKDSQTQNKYNKYILYLYGSACPACVHMKKVIQQYVKSSNLTVSIYGINIEKIPSMQDKFKIRSIPTIVLMQNNKILAKKIGSFNSLQEFETFIKKYID